MKLIFLGPPGAGKGTQCQRIVEKYKVKHLSSGDILRAERKAGSDLGQKAQSYMDSGGLVPDDLIIDMMMKHIGQAGDGYVLDGFPRTTAQAEALDQALENAGEKLDAIVNLIVDDESIVKRLSGRRSCPVCGAVYHIENLKPKVDNQCDKGCGELVQRPDDKEDVIRNRLNTYHDQTAAVTGYYRNTGKTILDINGDQGIDQVTGSIFSSLDSLNA